MKVRELMTKDVFTLTVDHKLDLANDIMQWQRIRHIPVVDKLDNLVGMLTHRDLLRAAVSSIANISSSEQKEIFGYVFVKEVMSKDVITIHPDADLRDAAQLMMHNKLGCLPVIDGRKLVGIITESDFMALAWKQFEIPELSL